MQPLDINGGYVQKLGPGSCRGANGGPVDYYEFTLPSDAVVAMILTSSELDGYLTLTDSAGNLLRSDDNSYGYGDPLIDPIPERRHIPARRARGVRDAAAGYTRWTCGRSWARARRSAAQRRRSRSAAAFRERSISPAASTPTRHSPTSTKSRSPDSATVDVRLDSSAFDAYLLLLDAKGNLVDQDDDSGGGTNARIHRLVAPGTYYVVAKPVSDYTSGGAYTVSVQAELQPI